MKATARPLITRPEAIAALDQIKAMLAERETGIADVEALTRLEEAMAELRRAREWSHAMVLALIQDEPVPVKLFRLWASHVTIWRWATRVDKAHRLPTQTLNGKLCVRPSDFFTAFKSHGRATSRD